MNQEERNYCVILIGIEGATEEKKESFCKKISENSNISLPLLIKIVDHCPIVLKRNLSLNRALELGKILKSFGAIVAVEEKKENPPIFLEFKDEVTHPIALESSDLRKIQGGEWKIVGRAKNISEESLHDAWILVQTFNDFGELLTFEEAPIPFNPIPPGEAFPFKVIFEGDFSIQRVSIAFKNASGCPIPAVDRRKKREWEGIEIKDEIENESQFIDSMIPLDEFLIKGPSDLWKVDAPPSESESPPQRLQETQEIGGEDEGQVSKEDILLSLETASQENIPEPMEESLELTLVIPGEDGYQAEEESRAPLENESSQTVIPRLAPPPSEEPPPLLNEISLTSGEKEPFTWIEEFRKSIENYYQKHRDIFSIWFETYQRKGGWVDSLHPLLAILVHARFNQANVSEKTLGNTKRVVRFIAESNLRIEEIPPLEETPFFSGEAWRDLFHKAFPKLQQVANNILRRKKWDAIDLERLIGVIPHMSDKNSRMSTRWMHELVQDVIEIDFSNTLVNVGEKLYRVASRLGVVDPHFDYYQGKNSAGDLKIQSFAKVAFPQNPIKIEEPMTWVGSKEEEGGYCFPIQPRCEGCLFETFCPRLYFYFNPSGKGMGVREEG